MKYIVLLHYAPADDEKENALRFRNVLFIPAVKTADFCTASFHVNLVSHTLFKTRITHRYGSPKQRNEFTDSNRETSGNYSTKV